MKKYFMAKIEPFEKLEFRDEILYVLEKKDMNGRPYLVITTKERHLSLFVFAEIIREYEWDELKKGCFYDFVAEGSKTNTWNMKSFIQRYHM